MLEGVKKIKPMSPLNETGDVALEFSISRLK